MKQAGKTIISYVNIELGKNFTIFSYQIFTCSAIFLITHFFNNVKDEQKVEKFVKVYILKSFNK